VVAAGAGLPLQTGAGVPSARVRGRRAGGTARRGVLAGRGCWLAWPVEPGGQVHDAGLMDSGTGGGRVLGVDACRRGWMAVAVEGTVTGAYLAEDIQALVARASLTGGRAPSGRDRPPPCSPAPRWVSRS
jgi:hypothetical protein